MIQKPISAGQKRIIDENLSVIKSFVIAPGYQLRLEWRQIPYTSAPESHWSYCENSCDSGPDAGAWIAYWLIILLPSIAKNLRISRREVGQWEALWTDRIGPDDHDHEL